MTASYTYAQITSDLRHRIDYVAGQVRDWRQDGGRIAMWQLVDSLWGAFRYWERITRGDQVDGDALRLEQSIQALWEEARRTALPTEDEEEHAALGRLFVIAHEDGPAAYAVAEFLLSLYDANAYAFHLTSLAELPPDIGRDCLQVLQYGYRQPQGPGSYLMGAFDRLKALAKKHRVPNRRRLRDIVHAARFEGEDADQLREDARAYLESCRY